MNNLLSEKDTKAVLEILTEALGVETGQLTQDALLKEDLGADSLTMVEIQLGIDDQFNLSIPDERAERIRTVGDIFELIAELVPPQKIVLKPSA